MLPHVVRFNGEDPAVRQAYAELASAPEIACASDGHEPAWEALIERLDMLLKLAEIPRSLAECEVKREMITTLAEEAARQWTATFNPRAMAKEDFVDLYESAYESA
jgi:alcohol dehydrogenase